MLGNKQSCRNTGCDEGRYLVTARYLCEDCFRRHVGDAIKEVEQMIEWAYVKGREHEVEDLKKYILRTISAEVN